MGAAIAAINSTAPLARGCCTPRWLPAVRLIRCVQHPRAKGAPTIAGKTGFMDAGWPKAYTEVFTVGFRTSCRDLCRGCLYLLSRRAATAF